MSPSRFLVVRRDDPVHGDVFWMEDSPEAVRLAVGRGREEAYYPITLSDDGPQLGPRVTLEYFRERPA